MTAARPYPPLPCPFCGAVGLDYLGGSSFRWRMAECVGCGASLGDHRTDEACLEAWNRRAAPEDAAPQPIGHVTFPKHRKAPDVDWASGRNIRLGMPLYAEPCRQQQAESEKQPGLSSTAESAQAIAQPPEPDDSDEGKDHSLIADPVLREVFQAYDREQTGHWYRMKNVAALLRDARSQPPEAAPDLWRCRFPNGKKWHYTEVGPNDSSRPELTWQPLFAGQPKASLAVAWQARIAGHEWVYCTQDHHDMALRSPSEWPDLEVRALTLAATTPKGGEAA